MVRSRIPSNVDLESSMPEYKVKPSNDFPDWLLVFCPREECPSRQRRKEQLSFIVHRATWTRTLKSKLTDLPLAGRSCPYCYMTAKIPKNPGKSQSRRGKRD